MEMARRMTAIALADTLARFRIGELRATTGIEMICHLASGDKGPSALARLTGTSAANATGVADKLEKAGVIAEASSDDRRHRLLTLTPKGRDILNSALSEEVAA